MADLNLSPTPITFSSDPSLPPGAVNIPVPDTVTTVDTALDPALAQSFDQTNNYIPTFEQPNPNAGLQGAIERTRSQGNMDNGYYGDWRVRLSLAPSATYLYNDPANAGILKPLAETYGVIFPYTPSIQITYNATYDPATVTHSNYKIFQYQSSAVENVTIQADFTAQDTTEARYLLAVIHFFRTVTKMFYGKDLNPKAGTPPPLCFLHGLGTYQFDNHPLVITNFTYNLPEDVDYIRADNIAPGQPGVSTVPQQTKPTSQNNPSTDRLSQSTSPNKVTSGGGVAPPDFVTPSSNKIQEPTYIPTRIKLSISASPVVSRNDISNNFSLQDYGSGMLLRGTQRNSGGIW